MRPDINKGHWSLEEEVIIYLCWKRWGNLWARIGRLLEGRSDNRVKNHFNCHLRRRLDRDPSYVEFMENAETALLDFLNDIHVSFSVFNGAMNGIVLLSFESMFFFVLDKLWLESVLATVLLILLTS